MAGGLFRAGALVALLAVLVAGCSIGDVRRPVPRPASAPPSVAARPSPTPTLPPDRPAKPSTPPEAGFDEVRRVRIPVLGYDRPHVEFTSADRGYALFGSCLPAATATRCPALLFTTADGGRSWQSLPHPRPFAENHQLYTSVALVLLLAEPHGWYASTDGGATFRYAPPALRPPAEYHSIFGRYSLDEETTRVGEWREGRFRPLPSQPPVPEPNTVTVHQGAIFVAGSAGNRPRVASSLDAGRSWRIDDVPYPHAEELGVLRVMTVPEGDRWLIGEQSDRTGFPHIWRHSAGAWVPVPAEGSPARAISVAPLGGGLLLVTGADGAGVVDAERYRKVGWPLGGEYARVLDDGTVFCVRSGPDDIVLGVGRHLDRRWIRLRLTRF